MSYFLRFSLPIFILISCTDSTDSVTEQDAKDFLAEVQEKAVTEGPVYSSAYWIQSTLSPMIHKKLLQISAKEVL